MKNGAVRIDYLRWSFAAGIDADRELTLDAWRVRFFFVTRSGDFTGYAFNGVSLAPVAALIPAGFDMKFGGLTVGPDKAVVNLNTLVRIVAVAPIEDMDVTIERQYWDPRLPALQG